MYYELNTAQNEQLLKPLNGTRVAERSGGGGKKLKYLEAWDVKAHLNRIFGITGWSWDVTDVTLAFEDKGERNWEVGYKVIGCLRLCGASYSEAAVGFASLPSRGEAHDMACKTAESDALKRAAINLGDQFGLSLYNNGSLRPVVGATLATQTTMNNLTNAVAALVEVPVTPAAEDTTEPPVDTPVDEPVDTPEDESVEGAPAVEEYVTRLRNAAVEGDLGTIITLKVEITKAGLADAVHDGKTLAKIADLAVVHAGKANAKAALGATEVPA